MNSLTFVVSGGGAVAQDAPQLRFDDIDQQIARIDCWTISRYASDEEKYRS